MVDLYRIEQWAETYAPFEGDLMRLVRHTNDHFPEFSSDEGAAWICLIMDAQKQKVPGEFQLTGVGIDVAHSLPRFIQRGLISPVTSGVSNA